MQGEAAGYRTSHKIYILYLYIVRNNEMDKDEGTKENRIPSKKELKDAKAELSSVLKKLCGKRKRNSVPLF